jgi:hypothetical protein
MINRCGCGPRSVEGLYARPSAIRDSKRCARVFRIVRAIEMPPGDTIIDREIVMPAKRRTFVPDGKDWSATIPGKRENFLFSGRLSFHVFLISSAGAQTVAGAPCIAKKRVPGNFHLGAPPTPNFDSHVDSHGVVSLRAMRTCADSLPHDFIRFGRARTGSCLPLTSVTRVRFRLLLWGGNLALLSDCLEPDSLESREARGRD